jgi:hypothetical protein
MGHGFAMNGRPLPMSGRGGWLEAGSVVVVGGGGRSPACSGDAELSAVHGRPALLTLARPRDD